jgi:hypothetical protein
MSFQNNQDVVSKWSSRSCGSHSSGFWLLQRQWDVNLPLETLAVSRE